MHQERRKNGLSPPYSGPQVGAWLALIALSIEFPVVVSPILPIEASIPVTIFVGGLLAASFYFGYQTQVIDPMDAHLAQHLKSLDNAENGNATNSVPDEPLKQVRFCLLRVKATETLSLSPVFVFLNLPFRILTTRPVLDLRHSGRRARDALQIL